MLLRHVTGWNVMKTLHGKSTCCHNTLVVEMSELYNGNIHLVLVILEPSSCTLPCFSNVSISAHKLVSEQVHLGHLEVVV